jgi:arginyl-tRNA synthetase
MIREAVTELLKEHLGVEEVPLNVPPKPEWGDFSSAVCLSLAKQRRRPPMEIAREAAKSLESNLPLFVREVAVTPPGYLNFRVDWTSLGQHLISKILEEKDLFCRTAGNNKEKVFIEHTDRKSVV